VTTSHMYPIRREKTGARRFAAVLSVLAVLAVLAVLVLGLAACSGGGETKGPRGPKAAPVTAATAVTKDAPIIIRAVGNVEPFASVAVKSQVGGMITEQYVHDGQDVKAGDKLFQIDPRPFQLAIAESKAKIERDQALLNKAEQDLKRYEKLRKEDAVAQGQYDETYAAAKTLEGTIKLNQAELDRAALDLEFSTIKAPMDGRVGDIILHKGNIIKANDDRSMTVINQFRPVLVSFSTPERHLPDIMDMFAKGKVQVTAEVQGREDKPESGELYSVDNEVDKETGTIQLKGLFQNENLALWPGRFVRVNLRMPDLPGAIMIPTKAVMAGIKGPYVYVIGKDKTVEPRNVTAGPIIEDETVVEKGLAPGEQVVAEGQLRLAPGAKVEIKTADDTRKAAAALEAEAAQ